MKQLTALQLAVGGQQLIPSQPKLQASTSRILLCDMRSTSHRQEQATDSLAEAGQVLHHLGYERERA